MTNRAAATTTTDFEDLFPAKLHYVLEQVEVDEDGPGDVISWRPHGRAFLVNDRKKFVEHYLPNWFRQTTWASFQRQLNHYDFKRITSGPDRNAYYHPCFVKGDRSLCQHIRRVKVKGDGPRKPSKPDEQPNFYQSPLTDTAHVAALSRAVRQSVSTKEEGGFATPSQLRPLGPQVRRRTVSGDDESLAPASPPRPTNSGGLEGSYPLSLLSMLGGSLSWNNGTLPHPGHNAFVSGPTLELPPFPVLHMATLVDSTTQPQPLLSYLRSVLESVPPSVAVTEMNLPL